MFSRMKMIRMESPSIDRKVASRSAFNNLQIFIYSSYFYFNFDSTCIISMFKEFIDQLLILYKRDVINIIYDPYVNALC